MKKSISYIAMAMLSISQVSMGGKAVVPPTAPVAPIATISPLPYYIGVGIIASSIQRDPCPCSPNGPDLKDHRYGAILRVGMDANQYIGVEARWLKTLESGVFSETTHYGLFLKPQYHIGNQSNIYGLLGYGKTKVDLTNGILSCNIEESGFSYGVGFEYDLTSDKSQGIYDRVFDGQGDQEKGWGLWIDYQRLFDNEGQYHLDTNILTFGITYDF